MLIVWRIGGYRLPYPEYEGEKYVGLDYKYKNLLNVGLLARYDGNSAIQSDHRWMFTPAASAEWNLKNQFFTGSTALSGLSLRASYARIAKSFQSDRYELGPQYLATSITWSGEPLLSSANGFATITRPYASGWVGYDLKLPYSDKMELALKGSFFDRSRKEGNCKYIAEKQKR